MKLLITTICPILIMTVSMQAQGALTPEWVKYEVSPIGQKAEGWGVCLDDEYIYWPFNANNQQQGIETYCHKLDPEGNLIWPEPYYLGGMGNLQAFVCHARDTFLYLGGRNCPLFLSSCDMMVVKVDKQSRETQWMRTHDFGQDEYEEVDGLEVIPGEGIYTAGWGQALSPQVFYNDFGLWKLDFNGETAWSNFVGQATTAEHQDGHMVVDEDYIFAAGLWGGTSIFNLHNGWSFLGKFSKEDGSLLDSVLFGHRTAAFQDTENALGMTSDGTDLFVTGITTPVSPSDRQLFIARFDKDLNQYWFRDWGGSGAEAARAIVVAEDVIWVAGQTLSPEYASGTRADAVLLAYSMDGELLAWRTWGMPTRDEVFRDMMYRDGALYLSGVYGPNINAGDTEGALLLKVRVDDIISSTKLPRREVPHVWAYPNPFSYHTRIVVPGQPLNEEARLCLVDVAGRFYAPDYSWTEDGIELRRGHLTKGMYFFEIVSADSILARGKIVVE